MFFQVILRPSSVGLSSCQFTLRLLRSSVRPTVCPSVWKLLSCLLVTSDKLAAGKQQKQTHKVGEQRKEHNENGEKLTTKLTNKVLHSLYGENLFAR